MFAAKALPPDVAVQAERDGQVGAGRLNRASTRGDHAGWRDDRGKNAMRLDAPGLPTGLGLTAAGWSREQIEGAIAWLVALLDGGEAEDGLMAEAVEMQNPPLSG